MPVVSQSRHGTDHFQLRLKFGKLAYCVIETRPGEDASEAARKLYDQVARLKA